MLISVFDTNTFDLRLCTRDFTNLIYYFSIFTGGKQGVPSNLPNTFVDGFSGCIKKLKIFRRKLDLFRQGGNSNLQQCTSN